VSEIIFTPIFQKVYDVNKDYLKNITGQKEILLTVHTVIISRIFFNFILGFPAILHPNLYVVPFLDFLSSTSGPFLGMWPVRLILGRYPPINLATSPKKLETLVMEKKKD